MPSANQHGSLVLNEHQVYSSTGNVTLTNQTVFVLNKDSGAATTLTLPASPQRGRTIYIKDGKGDAATNNITIMPASGNIDGAGSYVMRSNYDSVVLFYNGTQWNVVSQASDVVAGGSSVAISNGDGATDSIPRLQLLGTTKATASMLIASFNTTDDTTVAPSLNLLKSGNGTIGLNTIVASGEVLGEINFFGADGTDFESCAVSLRGLADAGAGAGDMPGRFGVWTSTDGAETPIERARITGTATLATLALGNAGATTGQVLLAGATSGVLTLKPNATAGTWTMELPAAVGGAGQQLTDAGANGVCSWAAASLGIWKNDLGILDPHEALDAVVAAPTHRFTYNKDVMPVGQWAPPDLMTGIFAEEAPWAMHGERDGIRSGIAFSSVNAFGYARAAIQAIYEDLIETIQVLPAELRAALPQRIQARLVAA